MSSCQGGSDASGHFTSWLENVNLDVETMGWGQAGWERVELELIGGLDTGWVVFAIFGLHNLTKV